LETFAKLAEEAGEYLAAMSAYGGWMGELMRLQHPLRALASPKAKENIVTLYHTYGNVTLEHKPASWSVTQWEHWHLSTRCLFAAFLGPFLSLDDRAKNLKLLTELLESTDLGKSRPELGETALWEVQGRPQLQTGRVELGHPLLLEFWQKRVVRDGGFPTKLRLWFPGASNELPCLVRLPGWRWDLCGDDAEVPAVANTQDYSQIGPTGINYTTAGPYFSALRGNVGAANSAFDTNVASLHSMMADTDPAAVAAISGDVGITRALLPIELVPVLLSLQRTEDAARILTALGLTWATADAAVDRMEAAWTAGGLSSVLNSGQMIRPRGSPARAAEPPEFALPMFSAEGWAWTVKLCFVLCTTWREVPEADVIAALPSPEQLDAYVKGTNSMIYGFTCLHLLAAQVCDPLRNSDPQELFLGAKKSLLF
jgi:hypothetical protein